MRIIIFGTGAFFMNRKDAFSSDEIVTFIDNDKDKWKKKINNIPTVSPRYINDFSYDKIIVMSRQKDIMIKQLINEFGVEESTILDYESYCEYTAKKKKIFKLVTHYKTNYICNNKNKKKILIITYLLNYSGSSLAAFYAALTLIEKGYDVALATGKADDRFVNEIVKTGVTVYIQELLEFCKWEQISWIQEFDMVILNTLPILRIINTLINHKPIVWWIHESKIEYEYLDNRRSEERRVGKD